MIKLPFNRAIRLKNNLQCPYCGTDLRLLGFDEKRPEHMVGRRFVPKGYLNGAWNFIPDACVTCNGYKARLEDGVSAMSHLTYLPTEEMPSEVRDDLERKLGRASKDGRGSFHPETGRPVASSQVEHVFRGLFGPAEMTFTFVSPPQSIEAEAELAKMQAQALFYLVCNVDLECIEKSPAFTDESRSLSWEHLHHIEVLRRSDWGNRRARELVRRTRGWQPRCVINTARGYFRAEMRRTPTGAEPAAYFWAVEWNKNVRVLGTIRSPDIAHPVENDLPEPAISWVSKDTGIYQEIQLPERDDLLFRF